MRSVPRVSRRQQQREDLVTLSEAFDAWQRDGLVNGRAAGTLGKWRQVGRQLIEVVGDIPVSSLGEDELEDFVADRRLAGNAANTINVSLANLQSWARWCKQRGLPVDIEVRRLKEPNRVRRIAAPDDVRRMLSVVDTDTFDGDRFRVMVLLMLDTGCRVSEACGMDLGDVSDDRTTIRVTGKGDKQRILYLSPPMSHTLDEWMRRRRSALGAAGLGDNQILFPSLTGGRQNRAIVGKRFRRESERAGLSRHLNAHGLRHRWATQHVAAGTSAFLLRQLGGWATMGVVLTYVHEIDGQDALEAAGRASLVSKVSGARVRRR